MKTFVCYVLCFLYCVLIVCFVYCVLIVFFVYCVLHLWAISDMYCVLVICIVFCALGHCSIPVIISDFIITAITKSYSVTLEMHDHPKGEYKGNVHVFVSI